MSFGTIVSVAYQVTTNLADIAKKTAALADAAGAAGQKVEGLHNQVEKLLGGLQTIAGFAGFGSLVAGLYHVGSALTHVRNEAFKSLEEFELMELSLAGVMNATGGASFAGSREIVKKQRDELYQYAAKNLGTFEQYHQAFSTILAPVRNSGGTSDTAVKLVEKLLPIYASMAPHDVGKMGYQLLESLAPQGMQANAAPALQNILRSMGVTHAQFNMMRPMQRMELLLKGAEKFKEMLGAGEGTMEAQRSTLESAMSSIGRTVFTAPFEETKRVLREINGLIDANRSSIDKMASNIGTGLVSAWRAVSGAVKSVAGTAGGPMLAIMSMWAAGPVLKGAGWLAGLTGRLGMAAVQNAGAGVLSAGTAAAGAAGGGLAAIPGAAYGVAGGLISIIAPLAQLALIVGTVGVALLALQNAAQDWWLSWKFSSDEKEATRGDDGRFMQDIQKKNAAASGLAPNSPGQLYGPMLLEQAAASGMENLTKTLAGDKQLRELGRHVGAAYQSGSWKRNREEYEGQGFTEAIVKLLAEWLRNPEREKPGKTQVHMNVRIEQTFKENQDPDRIATVTSKKLVELARFATQRSSGGLPNTGQ